MGQATKRKKMKPWSISTTVRNPARIADFLRVLGDGFDQAMWDNEAQTDYQAHLIAARMYGGSNPQFLGNLSEEQIQLLQGTDDISLENARAIMSAKCYQDPPMRGRTSFKPLQKFGFADLEDGNGRYRSVRITKAGRALLSDDVDDSDLFLRSLLKWQLPNVLDGAGFPASSGYDLKPFVCVLKLIAAVNRLCERNRMNQVGISQTELGVFGLTMFRWDQVEETAQEIIDFRRRNGSLPHWERDQALFAARDSLRPGFEMKHTLDYADNAVRYFRYTGLLRLRGQGRFLDHEPVRKVEISALLESDTGEAVEYDPQEMYRTVLGDPSKPLLPWETHRELEKTAILLLDEIEQYMGEEYVNRADFAHKDISDMKRLVADLRLKRDDVLTARAKSEMTDPTKIEQMIDELRSLLSRGQTGAMQKSLLLEWAVASGLVALNDAEEIRPNYPRGDDGQPRAHAPGGKPDIECYYDGFSCICEVTMLRDRSQWMMESQPVMRHLRDFEETRDEGEDVYCLFIAPSIHRDTINYFWVSVKFSYEGARQRIVPLTIKEFCEVLEVCLECRKREKALTKEDIRKLLAQIVRLTDGLDSSQDWLSKIPTALQGWKQGVLGER